MEQFPVRAPFMDQLEAAIDDGMSVMLTGPRGVGKTHAVKLAARLRGKMLHVCQGHSDLTVEELRGTPGLRDGNTFFEPGVVVRAVKDDAYFLFDEVNLCRPGVSAWMNNVIDDDGLLSIPETGEVVPVPSGFRAFFCFNDGYAGTRELNQALKDRCRVIFCDYWPMESELRLLRSALPRLAEVDLRRMVSIANGVRKARREGAIDFDFSIRTLIQWGKDADRRTQDLVESFKAVVLPKVGDAQEYDLQHAALVEIAQLKLR